MGYTPPDNRCDDRVGDIWSNVDGFCTMAGPAGNGNRDWVCQSIGNGSGEWSKQDDGNTCTYNSCDGLSYYGGSTCDGHCCPIAGQGVSCKRDSFTGDPWNCCLRDYTCTNQFDNCFTDSSHKHTCPPTNRDLGGSSCRNLFLDYCSGANDSTTTWRTLWTSKAEDIDSSALSFNLPPDLDYPCLALFYRGMYNKTTISCNPGITPHPSVPPSAEGFVWSQSLFYQIFNKYISQGGRPDGSASMPGVDIEFNDTLFSICQAYPGMCASTLKSYCSQYTTKDLIYNLDALKWCGCYLPDGEYSKYQNRYQLNPECTPTCNNLGVVPLPANIGVGRKYCQQTTCIIDDVTITLAQSQVGSTSGIQFNQLCSTCGGGATSGSSISTFQGTSTTDGSNSGTIVNNDTSIITNNIQSQCSCTLSDITVIGVGAKIGNIDLSQHCAGTTCYANIPAPGGGTTTVPVDCNSDSAIATGLAQGSQNSNAYNDANMTKKLYMIGFSIILIIIIVIIGFIFRPRFNITKDLLVTTTTGRR
jgi:hypothetical protein